VSGCTWNTGRDTCNYSADAGTGLPWVSPSRRNSIRNDVQSSSTRARLMAIKSAPSAAAVPPLAPSVVSLSGGFDAMSGLAEPLCELVVSNDDALRMRISLAFLLSTVAPLTCVQVEVCLSNPTYGNCTRASGSLVCPLINSPSSLGADRHGGAQR